MKKETRIVGFKVHVPNLEGDGVQEVVTIQIPVRVDPQTGEELITAEGLEKIEDTKARHMGLLSPAQIRELRSRIGLTQKQMSELLQAGEKSYTRWESGRARPSRMVNVILKLLYEGRVSVQDLRAVARAGGSIDPAAESGFQALQRAERSLEERFW